MKYKDTAGTPGIYEVRGINPLLNKPARKNRAFKKPRHDVETTPQTFITEASGSVA